MPGGGYKPESSGRQLPLLFFFALTNGGVSSVSWVRCFARAAEYLVFALSLYLSLFLITAGRQAGADIHGAAKTLIGESQENVLKTGQVTTRIVGEIDGNCQK